MESEILAWHFLSDDGLTAKYLGSRRRRVRVGEMLTIKVSEERPLSVCGRGLHWSRRAIDALQYAPGSLICRVKASGEVIEQPDKGCSTERTVIAMADATSVLHEFACWCAEQALLGERDAGREPDPRSWAAIEAKRRWLKGEITDEQLAAARGSAWAADWAIASASASAAWAADWASTSASASAAWAAYRMSAARDAQNVELENRLLSLLGLAA